MNLNLKKEFSNKFARGVFAVGGVSVLFIIFLIVFFLVKEVVPVFSSAKITGQKHLESESAAVSGYVTPDQKFAMLALADGSMKVFSLQNGSQKTIKIDERFDSAVLSREALCYSRGDEVFIVPVIYPSGEVDPDIEQFAAGEKITLKSGVGAAEKIHLRKFTADGFELAVSSASAVEFFSRANETDIAGNSVKSVNGWIKKFDSAVSGFAESGDGSLGVALAAGDVFFLNASGEQTGYYKAKDTACFGNLIGGRGFVNAEFEGGIGVWSSAAGENGSRFYNIHRLESMRGVPKGFSFSSRDRSFLAWDSAGEARLYHSTTERIRLSFRNDAGTSYCLSSKGGAVLAYGRKNTLYYIDNSHADISFGALFSKVWYEGYSRPEYVWQSTGGSDDFEPKYSLMPLIFGTVKGSIFALLFAIPLALTGAIFMNQFMHPNLHRIIKPVIEVMAGLPSVIIGFIGGLWLAPVLEQYLPGVLLSLVLVPLAVVVAAHLIDKYFSSGDDIFRKEIFILLPVIVVTFILAINATPFINKVFFAGDFRDFIFAKLGVPYDQRNAIVVGFAMGFAVIPVIFSLAEDALSFVPREIIAGSLALGLSRWQTVSGVVVRAAKAGIITAVMIGFGRAVGETMIVLMATGNTPVMSMMPFNGFRTMSANIAVELPETAVGSSPYRILFLSALMLFLLTFAINTLTDIIRSGVRNKK